MSAPPDRVLLFLKLPTPGQVKTRLAAALGPERATAIYRRLVERQLRALSPLGPAAVELHFAPGDAAAATPIPPTRRPRATSAPASPTPPPGPLPRARVASR
jgi:hypothetical protein